MEQGDKVEQCFLISLHYGFSKLELVTEHLEHEFNKILHVNAAVEDFLVGQIDEDTFLDTVEYYEQDMDEYIETANQNLKLILA